MGAIWDFISGKSTDWDAVNRQQEAEARRQEAYERTRPKRIKYMAYCKVCGEDTYPCDTQGEAIKNLQGRNGDCGRNNHTPVVERVEE